MVDQRLVLGSGLAFDLCEYSSTPMVLDQFELIGVSEPGSRPL